MEPVSGLSGGSGSGIGLETGFGTGFVLIAAVVYLVAGLVKGTIGLGLPTAAVSLMAVVAPTRTAIALAIVPMVLLNAWQIHRSGQVRATWHRFRRLALTMSAGIALMSLVAARVPVSVITLALGGAITLFALTGLLGTVPRLPERLDSSAQAIAGLSAGVLGGLAGIWAPPIVVYLSAIRVDKDAFVRASGLLLALGSVVLATSYAANGLLDGRQASLGLVLVVPALIGYSLGERMRARLDGDAFRRTVLLFFLLMGLNFVRRGVGF